ncbi:hypothetical protein EON63_09330 [archaeon]|nr:MAG: hypothetical protein EON63_09330 [archaeon]
MGGEGRNDEGVVGDSLFAWMSGGLICKVLTLIYYVYILLLFTQVLHSSSADKHQISCMACVYMCMGLSSQITLLYTVYVWFLPECPNTEGASPSAQESVDTSANPSLPAFHWALPAMHHLSQLDNILMHKMEK